MGFKHGRLSHTSPSPISDQVVLIAQLFPPGENLGFRLGIYEVIRGLTGQPVLPLKPEMVSACNPRDMNKREWRKLP